jgi:formamidopyrimidine-DNA glycosylase
MPELPEVEHAATILRAAALGRTVRNLRVLHRAQRRHLSPRAIARVRGARIVRVDRRGKHQLLSLSTGDTLLVHFRMTGDWSIDAVVAPVPKFVRVAIELDDGVRISLVDPRALSTVTRRVGGASGTRPRSDRRESARRDVR